MKFTSTILTSACVLSAMITTPSEAIAAQGQTQVKTQKQGQSQQKAPAKKSGNDAVKIYQFATYALGANINCEILDHGRVEALSTFKKYLEVAVSVNPQLLSNLKKQSAEDKGKEGWKTCLTRSKNPTEWANIDISRMVADAVITSIRDMKTDPKTCNIPFKGYGMSRIAWSYGINGKIGAYKDSPKKAQYEALRKNFAGILDQQCTKSRQSNFLLPAAAELRKTEDNYLFLQQGSKKKQSFTRIGSKLGENYDSQYVGIWRSYEFFFHFGNDGAKGFSATAFRTLKRSDNNFIKIHLKAQTTFGNHGKMFLTHDDRITAEVTGKLNALELYSKSSGAIAFEKIQEADRPFGKSKFVLSKANRAKLAAMSDDQNLMVRYSVNGATWNSYLRSGREVGVINLGTLRKAKAWGKAPFSKDYESK